MNADRLPLLCYAVLAERVGRVERVEAQLVARASEAARCRWAAAAGL